VNFVVGAKDVLEIETTAAELLRAMIEIGGDCVKAAMDLGEMIAVARDMTEPYFMVVCFLVLGEDNILLLQGGQGCPG